MKYKEARAFYFEKYVSLEVAIKKSFKLLNPKGTSLNKIKNEIIAVEYIIK